MKIREIRALIAKDVKLELRQKAALGGILVYIISTVFLIYLIFRQPSTKVWILLFWLVMLFASVSAIAKSFLQESKERFLYYYSVNDPRAVIIAKMLYNIMLMLALSAICFGSFVLFIGNPAIDMPLFALSILLGSVGFSLAFTLISAIASKAGNNMVLMAILSFPVIVPMLMILIRLSLMSIHGMMGSILEDIFILLAIDLIIVTVGFILFPYLWRD